MARESFDYEGRLFLIDDGSSGFVWDEEKREWRPISEDLAGRVWASGIDARQRDWKAEYGADRSNLPD